MLIKYLIFCFGAALVQGAYARQPGIGGVSVLDAPVWFSARMGKIIIPLIANGLFIAEIILGFVLVAWWAGLFMWVPALLVASIFIPGGIFASRNPAWAFFAGILIVVGAVVTF